MGTAGSSPGTRPTTLIDTVVVPLEIVTACRCGATCCQPTGNGTETPSPKSTASTAATDATDVAAPGTDVVDAGESTPGVAPAAGPGASSGVGGSRGVDTPFSPFTSASGESLLTAAMMAAVVTAKIAAPIRTRRPPRR